MKFATTKERILKYLDIKDIKIKEFFEETQIKRGFLDADKLNATVSDVFIAKIIATYPDINLNWLITGKGDIIMADLNIASEPEVAYLTIKDKGIPLLTKTAQAGHSSFDIQTHRDEIDHYFKIPFLKETADFAIKIEGDSMFPLYNNGCYVACKKIEMNEFKWEKPYVIWVNYSPMIKRLYPAERPEFIICRSDNKNFRDFEILKTEVNSIARILALVRFDD